MQLSPGTTVDRYVVEHELGRGGMAVVYAVRHRILGTPHALKVLHAGFGAEVEARLIHEGQLQARLAHPNVVPVRDVLRVGDGVGLLMPRVFGPTLAALLEAHAPDLDEAATLFRGMVTGVAAAHALGLVHRDLKPANVLLDLVGDEVVPRVADFGLAKDASDPITTRAGTLVGTPAYAAPEQWSHSESIGIEVDLWSLGCVLYELLCGRRAFDHADVGELYDRITAADYPDPRTLAPNVPGAWFHLLASLLKVDPARRPTSAAAVLATLDTLAPSPTAPHLITVARSLVGEPPPTSRPPPAGSLDPSDTYDEVTATGPRHNLPPSLDAFVGREAELTELTAALQVSRLVTMVGPGGAGKTRLAAHHAEQSLPRWPGGAWLCDLTEARDVDGICAAVAGALEVRLEGDPVVRVGDALLGRGRTLLVLDNFEQVVAHAPRTVGAWLARAPEAALLVTSREVLRVAGERVVDVGPLALPQDASREAVRRSPATALLVARARAVRQDFEVDAANAAAIAELVTLLDGLPLAIELAAARLRHVAPSRIVAKLRERFDALRSQRRDTPDRHATLRATLDWSWNLLEPVEQAALAQLATFVGGFDLDAAAEVLDLSPWPEAPWPDEMVTSLVDRSLLRRVSGSADGDRFAPYVAVRAYALDRLAAIDPDAMARHARWAAARVTGEALAGLASPRETPVRVLVRERDNLAAGLAHAPDGETRALCALGLAVVGLSHGPAGPALEAIEGVDPEEAPVELRPVLALARGQLLRRTGASTEASEVLTAALGRADPGRVAGWLRLALGELTRVSGDPEGAASQLVAAEAELARADDRASQGAAQTALGALALMRGDTVGARGWLERALALHRRGRDPALLAATRVTLGDLERATGNLAAANDHLTAALRDASHAGDRHLQAFVLQHLGLLAWAADRDEEAGPHLEAAVALHKAVGDRGLEGEARFVLGLVHQRQGDLEQACAELHDAIARSREVGAVRQEGLAQGALSSIDLELGRVDEAIAGLERGMILLRKAGDLRYQAVGHALLALARLATSDLTDAVAQRDEAERLVRTLDEPFELAFVLACGVPIAVASHDVRRATAALSEAETLIAGGHPEQRVRERVAAARTLIESSA